MGKWPTREGEIHEDHKHRQVLSQRRLWQNNIVCQGPSAGLERMLNGHQGLNHMEVIACIVLFKVRDASCLAQLVVHARLFRSCLISRRCPARPSSFLRIKPLHILPDCPFVWPCLSTCFSLSACKARISLFLNSCLVKGTRVWRV